MQGERKSVFIVGLPRTGTKLMRSVLESHSSVKVKIAPELWYFGDLFRDGIKNEIERIGNMEDESSLEEFVSFMYSGKLNRTYCNLLKNGKLNISRDLMLSELKKGPRTYRGIYTTLLRLPAIAAGIELDSESVIIGEKMPGNLYHVDRLLQWFPNAKIIHTFRDPRAIVASDIKRILEFRKKNDRQYKIPEKLISLAVVIYISLTWVYAVRLHHIYKKKYPNNYYLSRYEDLVCDPRGKVTEICKYVDIDLDENMFYPSNKGSSYNVSGGGGFDVSAVERWESYLNKYIKVWMNIVTGRWLSEFGYKM